MGDSGVYPDFVSVADGLELNKPWSLAFDYGVTSTAVMVADALDLQDKLISGGDSALVKTAKNGLVFWLIGRTPQIARAAMGM